MLINIIYLILRLIIVTRLLEESRPTCQTRPTRIWRVQFYKTMKRYLNLTLMQQYRSHKILIEPDLLFMNLELLFAIQMQLGSRNPKCLDIENLFSYLLSKLILSEQVWIPRPSSLFRYRDPSIYDIWLIYEIFLSLKLSSSFHLEIRPCQERS